MSILKDQDNVAMLVEWFDGEIDFFSGLFWFSSLATLEDNPIEKMKKKVEIANQILNYPFHVEMMSYKDYKTISKLLYDTDYSSFNKFGRKGIKTIKPVPAEKVEKMLKCKDKKEVFEVLKEGEGYG